jgi:hypothetical protein
MLGKAKLINGLFCVDRYMNFFNNFKNWNKVLRFFILNYKRDEAMKSCVFMWKYFGIVCMSMN